MCGKDALGRDEREVAEVLVIDRVELILRHQAHQMRKLHRDDAALGEQQLHPAHEAVQVRHLGQDVVSDDEVGLQALADEVAR